MIWQILVSSGRDLPWGLIYAGSITGLLMTVLGFTILGYFNLKRGELLGWEGAQQVKSVHWARWYSDLRRAIIPSSFCKRPRIINTSISYQADKLDCGMNKLSAWRGGLAKSLGFAESSWKMLMPAQEGPHLLGRLELPASLLWTMPPSQVTLEWVAWPWYSCLWYY